MNLKPPADGDFGTFLKRILAERKLRPVDASYLFKIQASNVLRYLKGENITLYTIRKIEQGLGIKIISYGAQPTVFHLTASQVDILRTAFKNEGKVNGDIKDITFYPETNTINIEV